MQSIWPAESEGHVVANDVEALLEDLRSSQAIYSRMIELTREQSRVLDSGNAEQLVAIARSKESELERLRPLDERMARAREIWDSIWAEFSEGDQARVREAMHGVESTLRELLELEEEQRQAIVREKDSVLQDIHRVEASRRSHRAYAVQAPHATGLLDHTE